MTAPLMILVAGPSGSGKSTVFPCGSFGIAHYNVDDRAAAVIGSYWAIPRSVRSAIGAACEAQVSDWIAAGRPFALESTLRSAIPLEQARRARARGYTTCLLYLSTASADEGLRRVRQRALAGGHTTDEAQIRAIHAASWARLPAAVATFELARIYDSSARWQPPRLIASKTNERLEQRPDPPPWWTAAVGG